MTGRSAGLRKVVYFVCTGNAARSPMAAAMMKAQDADRSLEIRSAGTLVVEGQPLSVRTRRALALHGLSAHDHRSRQFKAADAAEADLIVVMEPLHVRWMRARFPAAAAVTGSLRRLARDLPRATGQLRLAERIAALGLDAATPEPWEEVVDPGGGEQHDYDRAAVELAHLVEALHRQLTAVARP